MVSSSSLAERYRERRLREIEESHTVATFLGSLIFPVFVVLDFTQPENVTGLLLIRGGMTLLFVLAFALARKGIRPGGVTTTALTLLFLSTVAVTAMCVLTRGIDSPFYAGINLLILTAVAFPPGSLKQTIGACVGVVAVYAAGIAFFTPFEPGNFAAYLRNLLFIGSTLGIGVATAVFQERLRWVAFCRQVEAEDVDAIRRALGVRDEFISIASHELKTPITSMKLQNDLVKRELGAETGASGKLRQWVDRNDKQLLRLIRLVEDMLDISRLNTGRLTYERTRFDLSAVVREVGERFADQFRYAAVVPVWNLRTGAIGVWDRFRIEQIVTNLFSNVAKYAQGSTVEIEVGVDDGGAFVRVEDHGSGVAPENRERIFERFERAHSSAGVTGLGLGLYISRRIAEGHGGKIWVEETPGGGSTFMVRLPLDGPAPDHQRGRFVASEGFGSSSIESGSAS